MSRIRVAAALTIVGLGLVCGSLFRPHTYSFLAFLALGLPAVIAGAMLFVLSPRRTSSKT